MAGIGKSIGEGFPEIGLARTCPCSCRRRRGRPGIDRRGDSGPVWVGAVVGGGRWPEMGPGRVSRVVGSLGRKSDFIWVISEFFCKQ